MKTCKCCGIEMPKRRLGRSAAYCSYTCSGFVQWLSSIGSAVVTELKKSGELKYLDGSVFCVDCGKVAKHYDHRNYSEPHRVDPVCISCNLKRGPAKDIKELFDQRNVDHLTIGRVEWIRASIGRAWKRAGYERTGK